MQETARLHSYDLLRGVAILGVVAFHTACFTPTGIGLVDSIFGLGKLGVQLFFFVSALTMCHMWEQRHDERNRVAKFYVRRFMRIAPLFWLAALFYVLVNGMGPSFWAHDGMTRLDFGLTMLFLHGFWPQAINNVVPGGWSIAVEMTFYALFPLVIGVIGSRRHAYLALAGLIFLLYKFWWHGIIIAALATGAFGAGQAQAHDFLYFNFLHQSPIFLIGCYLHFAFKQGFARRDLVAGILFAVIGIATGHKLMAISAGLGVLVYLAINGRMRNGLLEVYGQNSFAVYLVHFFLVQIVGSIMPDQTALPSLLLRIAVVAGASFALARLLHFAVERPVAPLTRWFVTRVDRTASEASPALAQPHRTAGGQ